MEINGRKKDILRATMNNSRKITAVLLVICAVSALLSLTGCVSNDYANEDYVFGALSCSVSLSGGNSRKAGSEIFEMLKGIDAAASTTNPESAVYRFNNNGNKTASDRYEIDSVTYEMALGCVSLYYETEGLFNPAVYPLVEAWGVSADKYRSDQKGLRLPSDAEIADYLAYCKYEYLDIIKEGKGNGAKYYFALKPDAPEAAAALKIDFGGYAKGYASDKAAEICAKYRVNYGIINISGNVMLIGTHPSGDWRVHIANPFKSRSDSDEDCFCTIASGPCSPVSSGVYERYYSINESGEWKGTTVTAPIFGDYVYVTHIIDPSSGMPVNLERGSEADGYKNLKGGVVHATVFSESSALADTYAKVVTLLGMDEGIKFLERKGLNGLIIADAEQSAGESGYDYAVVGGIRLAEKGEGKIFYETFEKYAAKPGYGFAE